MNYMMYADCLDSVNYMMYLYEFDQGSFLEIRESDKNIPAVSCHVYLTLGIQSLSNSVCRA